MGTLFNQPKRCNHRADLTKLIISEIGHFEDISRETGVTYDQVINTCNMLELRRKNDLYVDNGDTFDEQMAGFGELLKKFINSFEQAYGVTKKDNHPCFLEAIAMALGFENSNPIAGSIEELSDTLKPLIPIISKYIKSITE